jgi:hypothetical protein
VDVNIKAPKRRAFQICLKTENGGFLTNSYINLKQTSVALWRPYPRGKVHNWHPQEITGMCTMGPNAE